MAFRKITSLVDAAGEALGLTEDPLATIIGMRIEEAVDDDIDIENWEYSNSDDPDICDLILTTDGGDLQAVRAIKKKYNFSFILTSDTIILILGYKKLLELVLNQLFQP